MTDRSASPVLYLIPAMLGDTLPEDILPSVVIRTLGKLTHFVVEDIRTARRLLKSIDKSMDIDSLHFYILNEHTRPEELPPLLEPLKEGNDMGLLSEAGLPCVADPGSRLVHLAHLAGFKVKPLSGPSSIYLALMASGFNGQEFTFHGYLPVDSKARKQKIREMEADTARHGRTQIFIETPYRNNQLMKSLVQACKDPTLLCVACNLTTEQEMIRVQSIGEWKKDMPDLHKRPAVFLLYH